MLVRLGEILSVLPLKSDSCSATAASTASVSANSMYAKPLGCPPLPHRIVTRLTVPQPAKNSCSSSGVAE